MQVEELVTVRSESLAVLHLGQKLYTYYLFVEIPRYFTCTEQQVDRGLELIATAYLRGGLIRYFADIGSPIAVAYLQRATVYSTYS